MIQALRDRQVEDWDDIATALDEVAKQTDTTPRAEPVSESVAKGIAFLTFAYDIDGVTIEIAKYASCLEELYPRVPIHCVGGNFRPKADCVLADRWNRILVPHIDGWGKWHHGKWFAKLFYEDMPSGGEASRSLAREMWSQAVDITEQLLRMIRERSVGLLIPVNINSNPGNLPLAIASVLASEIAGCLVLNNNHDYYWEGGRPSRERTPGEAAGPRDHFFRNDDNGPFFNLFRKILPWNGERWIQVNINPPQSTALVQRFGFSKDDVFEIGTLMEDRFFRERSPEERTKNRLRMAHILSDGQPVIRPASLSSFRDELGSWMKNQRPLVCAEVPGGDLDIARESAIYFLQPTRVVERKRIARDWELIGALLRYPPFREVFDARGDMTITLHITGPVPIEHRADLERVLDAYMRALEGLPDAVRSRVFQAFSVGTEDHPSLHTAGLGKLDISDIYTLANVVLFPSLTEGRGLPIMESGAIGVPIICSRYQPEDVFSAVVGEHLPPEEQIQYDLFPEERIGKALLETVTNMLLRPETLAERVAHNRRAVRKRYSMDAVTNSFRRYIERLESLSVG
jgi:hypothetical protein